MIGMICGTKAKSLVIVGVLMSVLLVGMVNLDSDKAKAWLSVSGSQSGTWAPGDSIVYIEGDVTVDAGNTLTIAAGVQVYVNGSYQIIVNGLLVTAGVNGNGVLITLNATITPAPGGWKGIQVNNPNGQVAMRYTNV